MRQKKQGAPWAKIGMSRASWYRHGKPEAKPSRRYTAADMAKLTGRSVRTIERELARVRQERFAKIREYLAQGLSVEDAVAREQGEHEAESARFLNRRTRAAIDARLRKV